MTAQDLVGDGAGDRGHRREEDRAVAGGGAGHGAGDRTAERWRVRAAERRELVDQLLQEAAKRRVARA